MTQHNKAYAILLLLILLALAFWFTYALGQSSVRQATVVQIGFPYFLGTFHGKCAYLKYNNHVIAEACATEESEPEVKP